MSILLKNAMAVVLSPPAARRVDIRIRNGTIEERRPRIAPRRGEEVCDLSGRMVMPGFVCAHTHLYSALARGMPPPGAPPGTFLEILDRIWWKLDRALDEESIHCSALVGAVDAIRCGTTTMVDHHSSPGFIGGSLDVVREALAQAGMRGVLCYEVTDRGGKALRNRGLRENERFIRASRKSRLYRGMVGAHAPFTLGEASLRLCGELAEECGTGVHIHASEAAIDPIDAKEQYRSCVTDRLRDGKCLRPGSILAHGVHLAPWEVAEVRRARAWLVHNPRSNMNNGVGYAPAALFGDRGALGSDGFPADMLEEARSGFFKMRDEGAGGDIPGLLQGGQRLAGDIFGMEFGTLAAGSAADLVVMAYDPPTPVTSGNLAFHALFGMNSSMIESVMIGGTWVMKDRVIPGVDLPRLYERARAAASSLWDRMERMA